MRTVKHLLEKNENWAAEIKKNNPDFFPKLANQQTPEFLWIGCSDSRVPATQIVDLSPGDIFVHRNIANVVAHTDLNCLSVIQYAVEALKVKHIIVCGHYGCGGVKAALGDEKFGLIDNWLRHVRDVSYKNADKLEQLDFDKKHDLLCELNVAEQVKNVCNTPIVQDAWMNEADLTVHGWIYQLKNGMLKDLDVSIASNKQLDKSPLSY